MKTHPKNPTIAKIFREIGRVEELGSGFDKLFALTKEYAGNLPIIEDLPIFKFSLQIPFFDDEIYIPVVSKQVTAQPRDRKSVV